MNTELAVQKEQFSLTPRTFDEAMRFCTTLAKSELVPKDFLDKPANILVAVQWGMELGLQPMQAMQSIAVINGRPSLWGDAVLALVRASPLCEYVHEDIGADQATCRTKRKGDTHETFRTFTLDDAAKAGLKGKAGPWTQYPKRMLQMRARSWCLRDVYPDVLRGVHVVEEAQDIPEKDITNESTQIPVPQPVKVEPVVPTPQPSGAAPEPEKAPAAAKGEAPKAESPKAEGGTDYNTPASKGQIDHIRKKAKAAEIGEPEICKEFKLESLDAISVGTGNVILHFLADPAGYAGKAA